MTEYETMFWTAENLLSEHQKYWLTKGMKMLRLDFAQIGETFSEKICIQVGYPEFDIGRPWLGMYDYNTDIIYINPKVDGLMALDTLVHELIHATGILDHGVDFHIVAAAIGLDDTGCTAGAEEVLLKRLRDIQEILGPYSPFTDCVVVT